ncbi:MAG: hypothetical protein IKS71_02790 [Bacteroidales bacterium]|nr:hypothetical protein [Bacteroidales bacterium]
MEQKFSIIDANWLDTLVVKEVVFKNGPFLTIESALSYSSEISPNLIHSFDTLSVDYSLAEHFAVEKIRSRSEKIREYCLTATAGVKGYTHLANIYLSGEPTVYADKKLFGKDKGEDLSQFFLFYSEDAIMKVIGQNYCPADNEDFSGVPVVRNPNGAPFLAYFTKGTLFPVSFSLVATVFPEELPDKDINLKFVFPVTIEHYWSWLLELYENPYAEEIFSDTELILEVNLKNIKTVQ